LKPFSILRSIAAYLDEDEVDTDIIFPARFLLLLDKLGLGKHAFHERRHAKAGTAPFILDTPPYDTAQILVAGKNFGTGSSREQAVWALADFGLRCVIAPSFGEIFYANCFKNGILPIIKSGAELETIRQAAGSATPITVDLEARTISIGNEVVIAFEIEPYRRAALLGGLDEIGTILASDSDDIAAFEARQRAASPWLYLDSAQLAYFNDLEREKAID